MIFEANGRILQVITYQHHRKSQARDQGQCKLPDVTPGSIIEEAYNSAQMFRDVDVRKKHFQFLYSEGDTFHFMNSENYEQTTLDRAKIGDGARFMVDNMEVIGVFFDGVFRTIEVPPNVVVQVASAEPGFKGDSVSNLLKTHHLQRHHRRVRSSSKGYIKVDTRTGEYVERVWWPANWQAAVRRRTERRTAAYRICNPPPSP